MRTEAGLPQLRARLGHWIWRRGEDVQLAYLLPYRVASGILGNGVGEEGWRSRSAQSIGNGSREKKEAIAGCLLQSCD